MKTILCVEDEIRVLRNNKKTLTEAGFNVLIAENLEQARERMAGHPDGIVLDIMLPDGNGLEYLKELRAQGSNIPVLMLTAWNTNADIARGLDLGADDYIGKPFTYDVLLSRVKKMLSAAERVPERIIRGALSLDILSGQAFLSGVDLLLAQKEFALLLLFIQHEGKTLSAEYLYEKVWGKPLAGSTRALSNMIYRLRKSIDGSGYDILTKRGYGYCFEKEL
jgi:DNA-binding response OmpR family regulator